MSNQLLHQIALTKIPKVGPITAKNLIGYCGGVEEVFQSSKKMLLKVPGIGDQIAKNILQQTVLSEAEKELKFIEKNGIQAISYLDSAYPKRLKKHNDCPILLFYKGTANLNQARIVAVVGTRKPTHQGVHICKEIVEDLKKYNALIISGLAYGIDVAAHKSALKSGQETVGVLGHGLSRIYPATHKKVAEEMIARGGILTEYTSQTAPDRENFPMRNRLVAGMCDALLVVETAKKGGSMITANLAAQFSKQTFAVPGRIKDKYSQGCNDLIRRNKATLIENADQLAYVMHWEADSGDRPEAKQQALFYELTEPEKAVIDMLQQKDETLIDELSLGLNVNSSELAALLLGLEFQGLIRPLPGKRYVLA